MVANGYVDIYMGLQVGDEGKGKIVNNKASQYDIGARFNGSSNAGHTLEYYCALLSLHLLPSTICHKNILSVIGNGVAIPPYDLLKEIKDLREAGVIVDENNLRISDKAIITMPHHQLLDSLEDLIRRLGTTGKGVGPAFRSRTERDAITTKDLLDKDKLDNFYKKLGGMINNQINYLMTIPLSKDLTEIRQKILDDKLVQSQLYVKDKRYKIGARWNADSIIESFNAAGHELKPYLENTVFLFKDALNKGKNILAEGAQAARLDVDHGTSPYTTSSLCGTAGAITGLGIPYSSIRDVVGVVKLMESRVGEGPFDTQLVPFHTLIEMWRNKSLKPIFTKDQTEQEKNAAMEYMSGLLAKINSNKADNFETYQYFANLRPGEYGASTGRPRAVGWLNLPMIEYYAYLNGVNKLALTKLDSYVGVEKFPVCIGYTDGNLEGVPKYKQMEGYSDVRNSRTMQDLPLNAAKLVDLIQDNTKVKVSMISVGPMDEETIHLN